VKVEYLEKFSRDLNKITDKKVKASVSQIIEELKVAPSPDQIRNLKKLHGVKNAYRIRTGDYRIGIFIEQDKIELARIANRKEIYRLFP